MSLAKGREGGNGETKGGIPKEEVVDGEGEQWRIDRQREER